MPPSQSPVRLCHFTVRPGASGFWAGANLGSCLLLWLILPLPQADSCPHVPVWGRWHSSTQAQERSQVGGTLLPSWSGHCGPAAFLPLGLELCVLHITNADLGLVWMERRVQELPAGSSCCTCCCSVLLSRRQWMRSTGDFQVVPLSCSSAARAGGAARVSSAKGHWGCVLRGGLAPVLWQPGVHPHFGQGLLPSLFSCS